MSSSEKNSSLVLGYRLKNGTVVFSVDLEKNVALFLPAAIFGGESKFDDQNNVVEAANENALHGHSDWRRITDAEGKTLSQVWKNVAPPELRVRAAPCFWLASPYCASIARMRRGGEADWSSYDILGRTDSLPVPVIRSGPARS